MTNYKELIDTLRDLTHGIVRISNGSVLRAAADAIETLTAELAEERHRHDRLQDWDRGLTENLEKIKAERDAAVKCLEDAHACETCQHMDAHPDCNVECLGCQKDCQCRDCRDGSNFKWKGAKEDT